MNRSLCVVFLLLFVTSCGIVKKKTTYSKNPSVTVEASEKPAVKGDDTPSATVVLENASVAENVICTALTFSGVRYKFGGTTTKGMDCSGLLYVSFKEHNIDMPRVSYQMAEKGQRIKVKNVTKGDLLFFKTGKRGKKINHVGLVVDVKGDEIRFIHATSSRGVIVSSLREGYWNYAFVKATRVL